MAIHQDGEGSDGDYEAILANAINQGSEASDGESEDSDSDEGTCSVRSSGESGEAERLPFALADGSVHLEEEDLVLDRALNVSLTPENQQLHAERRPAACTNLSSQYARFGAVLLSQEQRMLVKGSLGDHGFDEDDDFLSLGEQDLPQPGAPVVLVGTGQPAAYLRSAGRDLHVVQLLGVHSSTRDMSTSGFLPLPTRRPQMGEWCLVVGDGPLLTPWHGVRGFCGPRLHNYSVPGYGNGEWHSVTFENSPPWTGEVRNASLPLECLAALPLPPAGSEHAPLESPVAPPQALPPLLESEAIVLAQAGVQNRFRGPQCLVVEQLRLGMEEEKSVAEALEGDQRRHPEINGIVWHLIPEEELQKALVRDGSPCAAQRAIQASSAEDPAPKKKRKKLKRLRRSTQNRSSGATVRVIQASSVEDPAMKKKKKKVQRLRRSTRNGLPGGAVKTILASSVEDPALEKKNKLKRVRRSRNV